MIRDFIPMSKKAFGVWSEAKASTWGASLAYYTLFSLAPLLVIVLAVAGLIYGPQAARGELAEEIAGTVGPKVAEAMQGILQNVDQQHSGVLAIIIGAVMLLVGASGVFTELQGALNAIWEVRPKPGRGFMCIIKERFLSFAMVLVSCFIMLVSLVVTSVLAALSKFWTPASLPGGAYLWMAINGLVSLGVITTLFALLYKYLPDVKLAWRDVWVGALVTSLLFTMGKYLLGLYLGRGSVASAFGAAGSLAVVLVWVYYSAQIFLFGAAFTRVYAEHHRHPTPPADNAMQANPATPGPMAPQRQAVATY